MCGESRVVISGNSSCFDGRPTGRQKYTCKPVRLSGFVIDGLAVSVVYCIDDLATRSIHPSTPSLDKQPTRVTATIPPKKASTPDNPPKMPPKAAPVRPATPTPPPAGAGAAPSKDDTADILVLQDFMDTIDQIPVEMTRVHSDLNELGAVLYCEFRASYSN